MITIGRLLKVLSVRMNQSKHDSRPFGATGCYGKALNTPIVLLDEKRAIRQRGD